MYLLFKHHNYINTPKMVEGDSKNNKEIKRKGKSSSFSERPIFDVGSVLQSFWIRCRSIFPHITDRKFMEGELRLVLYSGILLWFVYLLYQIIK